MLSKGCSKVSTAGNLYDEGRERLDPPGAWKGHQLHIHIIRWDFDTLAYNKEC